MFSSCWDKFNHLQYIALVLLQIPIMYNINYLFFYAHLRSNIHSYVDK